MCDCTSCQNYERAFAASYPEVIRLLQSFGIRIERPLEVMDLFWNNARDKRRYESFYSVKGELFEEHLVIYDQDAVVSLYHPDANAPFYANTGMEYPYFILAISSIELPWILVEKPDD